MDDVTDETSASVIVLQPSRIDAEGRGVYPRDVITIRQDLVEQGFVVTFHDPPERRAYERLNGVGHDLVVPFLISFAASGTWAALSAFARLNMGRQVKITAVRSTTSTVGTYSAEFTFDGAAGDAESLGEL